MPSSYVDIDRDEMEYVDGGYAIDFNKNWIAYTVDISLVLFGAGAIANGLFKYAMKYGYYKLAGVVATVTTNVSSWLGKRQNYARVLEKVSGILGVIISFSPGNAIATVLDYLDYTPGNKRIQF